MAIGMMGMALRDLGDLFHGGTAVGLSDAQLLARYATSNDGPAFAALVARHGPMVLATCRAILRHEHDVEDAFQATFLILAKRASSVRAGEALGGWLHRVAYRVAMEASAAAKQKHRRESGALAMAMTIPSRMDSGLEPDVRAMVHEEIDRLPDRQRLPVVLCDLEGLTYEQAAGRLRWTVPALRCQLAKARQRLRDRLTRRGLAGAALGVAIAASDATAAVPAAWAESAVAAATGGASSMAAGALAHAILRSLLVIKVKIVTAALFVAVGIATAGAVVIGAGSQDEPRPAMNPPAAAQKPLAIVKDKPAAPAEMIEVHGRVVDPSGRPVPGAHLQAFQPVPDVKPAPEAASDADGRFFMRVVPFRPNRMARRRGNGFPWVVASAPGFGPGWASTIRKPGAPDELTIRLVEDGAPIEGHIVDLEGRPVGGARVKVERIFSAQDGDLATWLARAQDSGVDGPWWGLHRLPSTLTTATDPDGRFRITGIGRDRIAELFVSGPTIATAHLYVVNRDGLAITAINPQAMTPERARTTYHARRFEYAAAPTKPIEGTIRDKDTGRPIAGVVLHGMVSERRSSLWREGVEAMTDAHGRYRLTGLPKGPAYTLFLEPGTGLPYTKATFHVTAESPAFNVVTCDIALKRGILVRGRVTDKATDQPVWGVITPFTFVDNPHVDKYPGYADSEEAYARVDNDGRYEIVMLPGRGILACWSDASRYRRGVGAKAIKGYQPEELGGSFNTWPGGCLVDYYHVLAEVNLDLKTELAAVDLQVDPGRTLTVTALDPEGKPISGTTASGVIESQFDVEQESPTIEVYALDPPKPRRVMIKHAGRKLVGSITLKGDETGPLTVRLQPWGTIAGRVVDDDGRPRGPLALHSFGPMIPIGRDGKFRIEGLVPGLKYGASVREGGKFHGDVFHDVIVAPGEVKDLGDVKVIPPRPEAGS